MKLFRLTFIILFLFSSTAFAFNIGGEFSSSYELSRDKGKQTEGLWENYLRIDNAKLYDPYVGFNFYGRYAQDDDNDSYTDIYSAYMDFSSFQKAVELKVGRFSYVGNRFLTLDGAELTVRTDYYLGVTAFAGSPEYFDADDRHVNETFRDTGDRLYGAKVFLNGVKDTTGFVSYSKEENDDTTLQQMLGLGLGRRFVFSDKSYFTADGKMQYDTEENNIYKGVLRMSYVYNNKLTIITDFSTYDVKDGSSYEQELVISNFSTGKEDKYAYTVQYAVTEHISPYQSTVRTRLQMPSDEVVDGEIYKLGVDVDYYKAAGIRSNVEGYYYNSDISNAKGGSFALDLSLSKALRLSFESEMLRLENTTTTDTIYSVYADAEYDFMKYFTLSVYGENNQKTRYLPENRYGVKLAYRF